MSSGRKVAPRACGGHQKPLFRVDDHTAANKVSFFAIRDASITTLTTAGLAALKVSVAYRTYLAARRWIS